MERLIREQGRIDLLFEMSDFHGWRVATVRGKLAPTITRQTLFTIRHRLY